MNLDDLIKILQNQGATISMSLDRSGEDLCAKVIVRNYYSPREWYVPICKLDPYNPSTDLVKVRQVFG